MSLLLEWGLDSHFPCSYEMCSCHIHTQMMASDIPLSEWKGWIRASGIPFSEWKSWIEIHFFEWNGCVQASAISFSEWKSWVNFPFSGGCVVDSWYELTDSTRSSSRILSGNPRVMEYCYSTCGHAVSSTVPKKSSSLWVIYIYPTTRTPSAYPHCTVHTTAYTWTFKYCDLHTSCSAQCFSDVPFSKST